MNDSYGAKDHLLSMWHRTHDQWWGTGQSGLRAVLLLDPSHHWGTITMPTHPVHWSQRWRRFEWGSQCCKQCGTCLHPDEPGGTQTLPDHTVPVVMSPGEGGRGYGEVVELGRKEAAD